jgi:hypothetical protein
VSVILLSVIMLSVIMLNVTAPLPLMTHPLKCLKFPPFSKTLNLTVFIVIKLYRSYTDKLERFSVVYISSLTLHLNVNLRFYRAQWSNEAL